MDADARHRKFTGADREIEIYRRALTGGEPGVREVLLNLLADFDLTLALSGYKACRELVAESLLRSQ